MNTPQLTPGPAPVSMIETTGGGIMAGRWRMMRGMMMAGTLMVGLGGCISVKAPDKPIVIELNINIKQEVVYRLANDAAQTIDKNKELF